MDGMVVHLQNSLLKLLHWHANVRLAIHSTKILCRDHKLMLQRNKKFWSTSIWATNKAPNWSWAVKNGATKGFSLNPPFSQMSRTIWLLLKMRYGHTFSLINLHLDFFDIQSAVFGSQIFGPVQTIFKFKTLEEAIERSNSTSYGLAAGIMTKNLDAALTYCKSVDAGSLWVNCYDVATPQTPVNHCHCVFMTIHRFGNNWLDFFSIKKIVRWI